MPKIKYQDFYIWKLPKIENIPKRNVQCLATAIEKLSQHIENIQLAFEYLYIDRKIMHSQKGKGFSQRSRNLMIYLRKMNERLPIKDDIAKGALGANIQTYRRIQRVSKRLSICLG